MKTLEQHTQYWPRTRRRAYITGRFHYPSKVTCDKCGAHVRDVVTDMCYLCVARVEDEAAIALKTARGPCHEGRIHAVRGAHGVEVRRCPLPNRVRAQ